MIINIILLHLPAQADAMDMGCTMSFRKKVIILCIHVSMPILLILCSTPANGLTKVNVSSCIPASSILAETANCECFQGGRGGQDGRSCGYSTNLVDLVCSGVLILDLPPGEIYGNVTCL